MCGYVFLLILAIGVSIYWCFIVVFNLHFHDDFLFFKLGGFWGGWFLLIYSCSLHILQKLFVGYTMTNIFYSVICLFTLNLYH